MGLFQKNTFTKPVFYKDSHRAELELAEINKILSHQNNSSLEKKAKLISCGIEGEKNIHFELENSHMPMYVLHDIYLEDEGLSAQIDYIIMTRKTIFIIECKNLIGTIHIDSNANFVREYTFHNRKIKEGIYSPITQNQRHLELIKQIRGKSKNPLQKKLFEKNFTNNYRSLIVLANSKSILNAKYAKKEIKNIVIKADQLINYIQQTTSKDPIIYNENDLIALSNWFMQQHKEKPIQVLNNILPQNMSTISQSKKNIDIDSLITDLKSYRLKISRDYNLKPYFIFTNKQLDEIILKLPMSINELKEINGFAEVKCQKYGTDIINIIQKYKLDN